MTDRSIIMARNNRHVLRGGLSAETPHRFAGFHDDSDDLTYTIDMSAYLDGAIIVGVTREGDGVVISNEAQTHTRFSQRLRNFGTVKISVLTSIGDTEQFTIVIKPRLDGKAYVMVSAAITDGDKGDIIVSGGGSSWVIDPGVLTAFGRSLVDDADAAAARATMGLTPTAANTAIQTFDTVAAVNAANIHSSINHIRTAGYYTAGDGGGSLYKKSSGTPTGVGTKYITSQATVWELSDNNINVLQFGAKSDGITDATAAFAGLINFLNAKSNGTSGGGIGKIPQGRYLINGTLPYLATNVGLEGEGPQATLIDFQNGSNNCFLLGTYGTATRGQTLTGMYLGAQGKTGGKMIFAEECYNAKLQRIVTEGNWTGVEIGRRCNGVILEDCTISATQGVSPLCLGWKAGASQTDRCDALTIRNVILDGKWTDATCFEWDGLAHTADVHTLRMLHAKYGLIIANSANSASFYPQFLNAHNIQGDGFKQHAVWIKGGNCFKFTGCDLNNASGGSQQGSADLSAVQIDADASHSVTRSIQISDTRIGGSRREGLVVAARDVKLANVIFYSTSVAGSANYAVIRCAGSAKDVLLANIRAEEFGGAALASHIVKLDSGAERVLGVNLDAHFCVTSGVLDNSGNATNSFLNTINP